MENNGILVSRESRREIWCLPVELYEFYTEQIEKYGFFNTQRCISNRYCITQKSKSHETLSLVYKHKVLIRIEPHIEKEMSGFSVDHIKDYNTQYRLREANEKYLTN